jgi:hypothetical protein
MDIPIKMIDLATAICWAFLIMFFVSAVYSIKDLKLDFGNLQTGITPDGKIIFSLPVEIANNGYYNIGLFNLTTRVLDENGSTITEGSTLIQSLRIGEKQSILHNMTFDANRLLMQTQEYLFNDTQLNTIESVSMKLGEVIPVHASYNLSIPWGAPLHDFKLGEPQYSVLNYTHMQIAFRLSFDNHAFFDVAGEAQIRMYNSTGQPIGSGQTEVKASQQSQYKNYIALQAAVSSITQTGRFEIEFQTSLFSLGPLVIPYG